jgi:serine/threonine protein kinase
LLFHEGTAILPPFDMNLDTTPEPSPSDRYVVIEYLAEGGMGAIYIGKKLGAGGFEKDVVLKQLLPEFTQQEEFIDLFLREAKLSATLDHANIVHTIDFVTAGQDYFIVMEYLAGGDLRSLLRKSKRRGKRLSPAAALYIAREVLAALAYAHSKRDFAGNPLKLIHRDVSPSNLLVSFAGEVKLTDFGIAKASTHTSLFYRVKGKVGYMSPEQAKSEDMDHRSDLYSAAVCLYEMLTGERLFVHVGMMTSADEIYAQAIPLVSRKTADVPVDVDTILQKALSISPTDRYQTAGQLAEALTRCAHRHGLLMSSSELSDELMMVCGPPEQWRETDDDNDDPAAPGTAVLSDDDEDENDDLASQPVALRSKRPSKTMGRPPPEKMRGRELTSIINFADDALRPTGSVPLARFDDSGPVTTPPILSGNDQPVGSTALSNGFEKRDRFASPTPLKAADRLPVRASGSADGSKSGRFAIRWWMWAIFLLLAAIAVTGAIALSGPNL